MKRREPISHIMSKNVLSVNQTDSLRDVAKIFRTENVHHVPVIHGHEIVGIISSSDFNRLTFGSLYEHQEGADNAILDSLKIEQVMTAKPTVVNVHDPIRDVAEIFAEANFHALPVTDDNELKGIVTTKDLIKYLVELF